MAVGLEDWERGLSVTPERGGLEHEDGKVKERPRAGNIAQLEECSHSVQEAVCSIPTNHDRSS